MTYIAQEPEKTEAYIDQNGRFHQTREDAIDSNFNDDLKTAIYQAVQENRSFDQVSLSSLYYLFKRFINDNPDMIRVILGDRDAV